MDPADVVAVNQLMNLYGHVADGSDMSLLETVFVEDAILDCSALDAGRWEGLPAIDAFFSQGKPPHPPSHHASNVVVDEDEDGVVHVRSKWFAVDRDTDGMVSGDYTDIVVRTDVGWRIAERVATVRWLPNRPAGFEVESNDG